MESTEIHLLNAHPRKRGKITSNQPDIQILPEKILKIWKKIFLCLFPQYVIPLLLLSCLASVECTQDLMGRRRKKIKHFKNEFFPCALP